MNLRKVLLWGGLIFFSLAYAKTNSSSNSKKTKRLEPLKIEGRVKKPELSLESPDKIEGDGNFIDPYDRWELRLPAESRL